MAFLKMFNKYKNIILFVSLNSFTMININYFINKKNEKK